MCAGVQVVHEQVEEAERDVGPRVLQSEQRPGHLLPGHHIHLLGHSGPVHSSIIEKKNGEVKPLHNLFIQGYKTTRRGRPAGSNPFPMKLHR